MYISKSKRLVAAAILTAVLLLDVFQIGTSGTRADEAALFGLKAIWGKKTYNQDGTFKGCDAGGKECIILVVGFNAEVTVSSEGVNLQ